MLLFEEHTLALTLGNVYCYVTIVIIEQRKT